MKIVFLNDGIFAYAKELSTSCGGAERQQWLLARALVTNGWNVTVGVQDLLDPEQRLCIDGVKFVGIGKSRFVGIGKSETLYSWYQFLRSERPDWWYWRCAYHLWGAAVELARMTGVRTIFAAAFDTDVQVRHALILRPHWWPLYAWGLLRSDRIFVQHRGQLSALPEKWSSKARIVPSIAFLNSTIKSHIQRQNYVAWVGMLRKPKRPDLLIEIAQQTPTIHFLVCGGPTNHRSPSGYGEEMISKLRALPNIEFLGQISPDKAQQVIGEAAMLLSTSVAEGFPNTFLQAWSSGTPVISLKIDPDSVIERAGLGAVSGSIEGAGKEICKLMDSHILREEIASRAQKYIVENHGEAVVMEAFNHAVDNNFVLK